MRSMWASFFLWSWLCNFFQGIYEYINGYASSSIIAFCIKNCFEIFFISSCLFGDNRFHGGEFNFMLSQYLGMRKSYKAERTRRRCVRRGA